MSAHPKHRLVVATDVSSSVRVRNVVHPEGRPSWSRTACPGLFGRTTAVARRQFPAATVVRPSDSRTRAATWLWRAVESSSPHVSAMGATARYEAFDAGVWVKLNEPSVADVVESTVLHGADPGARPWSSTVLLA